MSELAGVTRLQAYRQLVDQQPAVLQQLWRGNDGSQHWRDVELVSEVNSAS